ncbi:chemotaxis protein CheX [Anaerocolumna sp. MB42-C2]|uniref:chemotaxis protein CheX n=1 Tax=Anaerocolumna sp. MB42-C2 TaxID=3070997 RepID=UPI0027E01F44|nr:chemotaxis protein CheX [Anaerocolumna sp. MB42-C2]WMJ90538.1 chemotaxis protein CheX [Anaerocolumna sp. MB42-C2]
MAGLNAEHINPFLIAATKILKDMCFVDVKIGKPYVKNADFTDDTLVIMIGITGEIRGQAMIAFPNSVACDIASKMIMMPVTQLDELATSAVCELGNMIMGNTATIFSTKGIGIDITPPTLCTGNVAFTNNYSQNICIPLIYDESRAIEINVALKD